MQAGGFVPAQTCQLLSGLICLAAACREEMEEGRTAVPSLFLQNWILDLEHLTVNPNFTIV